MNDPLEAVRAELARQDEAFAEIERTLASHGDAMLAVPRAFLDELGELTTPCVALPAAPLHGLRA